MCVCARAPCEPCAGVRRFVTRCSRPRRTLRRVLRFLGLAVPATDAEWEPLLRSRRVVHGSRPAGGKPPLPQDVGRVLEGFYRPWQIALAGQLSAVPDAKAWRAWAAASTEDALGSRQDIQPFGEGRTRSE